MGIYFFEGLDRLGNIIDLGEQVKEKISEALAMNGRNELCFAI